MGHCDAQAFSDDAQAIDASASSFDHDPGRDLSPSRAVSRVLVRARGPVRGLSRAHGLDRVRDCPERRLARTTTTVKALELEAPLGL